MLHFGHSFYAVFSLRWHSHAAYCCLLCVVRVCVCVRALFVRYGMKRLVRAYRECETDRQTDILRLSCMRCECERERHRTDFFILAFWSGANRCVVLVFVCMYYCVSVADVCTFSVCAHRAYTANVASTPYTAAAYSRHFGQSFNQLAHATAYIQSDFLIFRWIFHQNLLYILQFPITTTTKTKKSIKYPYIWNIKQQSCYFKEKKN